MIRCRWIVRFIFSAAGFFGLITDATAQDAVIDFSKAHQRIDGFGASSAWHGVLSDAEVAAAFKNDNNSQLGLSILRIRISTDETAWYKEEANAKNAKALGATILASPWSMPAHMKTNDSLVGGELKESSYAEYAAYLKRFCDSMKVIDVVSLQNEPDWHPSYESAAWSPEQFRKFCRENAQSIGTPVMMPEAFGFRTSLSDSTLDDSIAASHIEYIGGHLYGKQPFKYTKAIDLKKKIWMTEFNFNSDNADSCMILAKQILDCMYCSMNAYIWWYLRNPGCNLFDLDSTGIKIKKKGYVMAQFSKFVRPGYYRVDATYAPQPGVNVVAFKGTRNVVVAINTSASLKSQTFIYSGAMVPGVRKIVSSSSKNLVEDNAIIVTNNSFTTTLDAQSVNTFVSDGTVSVFNSDRDFAAGKQRRVVPLSTIRARHLYLLNGKRWGLRDMDASWSQPPGIFIMKGNAVTGIAHEKSLHILKKWPQKPGSRNYGVKKPF